MRILLRRAGVMLAAGLLVFCCSCERHHPDELPHHGPKKHGDHATKEHGDTHATKEQAAPSPASRGTPANFFPDKSKP